MLLRVILFAMLIFKFTVFILFLEPLECCSQIYRLDKLVIKVVFLLYLGFIWVCWTALVTILAFFVPYLLNFCYCRSAKFGTAPSAASLHFFVSLLIILNMFCMLFCCYHYWMGKRSTPGLVHSSKLILFSYH